MTLPFWHLLAPADARDPWWIWFLTAGAFGATAALSRWSRLAQETVQGCFYGCAWGVTAHLMVLAHWNDMHPFYSVGSVMAVVTAAAGFRSRESFAAYASFVFVLAAALFAAEPGPLKAAYWFGLVPAVAIAYQRLRMSLAAARFVARHQEDLESRVAARTEALSRANRQLRAEMEERELLEQQLRISQKMEAVGRLAGGVAHDFNNLLTVIRSYAEFLLLDARDERTRRDAEEIVRAGERAADLTGRLVAFARGRVTQAVPTDLNTVIEELLGMLRSVVGEDVETRLELASDLPLVRADRSQLDQLLLNLVVNAKDAMPHGGKLSVETRAVAADAPETAGFSGDPALWGWVRLTVSDTGEGMTEPTRSRAFEPFFTTKETGTGTGLGLSIVYGVVKQSGGEVRLWSEPGQGTRFDVYLPALSAQESVSQANGPTPPTPAPGATVLVVDDDPSVLGAAERALRDAGYRVELARDGEAALRAVETASPPVDLLVTDVVMPGIDGFDLAERLAALRPGIPLLYMSGHTTHPTLRGRELPPETVILDKPFTPGRLREKVAMALAAHGESARIGAASPS